MIFKWKYKTPNGFDDMIMNSDGENLIGLCFEDSRDVKKHILDSEEKDLTIFRETCEWLDVYFSGKEPDFKPKFKIKDITPFRKEVQDIMIKIPFEDTITYNDIAKRNQILN